jgi:hypothetical protein
VSLRQAIQDGFEAKELLENAVLQAAFADIEKDAMDTIRGSFPEDTSEREQAYWLLHALDRLRTRLRIKLDNGNLAAQTLEKQQEI